MVQVIVLCAGKGNRIKDLANGLPKCLLNIAGESILERQINAVKGYTSLDPIVVVGYKAKIIKSCFKNNDIKFIYNPEYATTNVLTSLWYALPHVRRGADLLYMPGDLIFDQKIIKKILENNSAITIAIQKRKCDDEAVKVILNGNRVTSIGKQLKTKSNAWEFIGMLKVKTGLVISFKETVDNIISSGEKNGYIFTALQDVIKRGGANIGYVDVKKHLWEEIDFAEDYSRANEKFSSQDSCQNK